MRTTKRVDQCYRAQDAMTPTRELFEASLRLSLRFCLGKNPASGGDNCIGRKND